LALNIGCCVLFKTVNSKYSPCVVLSYCAALLLFKFNNSKYSTMVIVWDLMIQHFQYSSIQAGTCFERKGITAASGET